MSSSSSSSSSSSGTPLTVKRTDPTYVSLFSLLSSPSSSSRHLNLLPVSGLYGSITLYLARLDTETDAGSVTPALDEFIAVLLGSESFWNVDGVVVKGSGTTARIHEDLQTEREPSSSAPISLLRRLYDLHLAAARAVFSKIEALLHQRNGSTGWGTQVALKKWVDGIIKAAAAAESTPIAIAANRDQASHLEDLPRLAITSGLLVGLGAYRQQQIERKQQQSTTAHPASSAKEKPALDVSRAFRAAQLHWILAWQSALEDHPPPPPDDAWEKEFVQVKDQSRNDSREQRFLLLLHLAGQVSPYLSDRTLSILKPEPILVVFIQTLLPLFQTPLLRLDEGGGGEVATPLTHALYPLLGPLSRIMAAAGETLLLKSSLQDAERVLLPGDDSQGLGVVAQLCNTAATLHTAFCNRNRNTGTTLSDANAWTSLKAFLFVSVQFFDSILDGVVEVLPSPVYNVLSEGKYLEAASADTASPDAPPATSSNIPPALTTLLVKQVESLMQLAFVTFSNTAPGDAHDATADGADPTRITSNEIYNRFTTYRHAFYGALEVIKSDLGASVHLLGRLQAQLGGANADVTARSAWLPRAHLTIYLDAAEQLVSILPNTLIESRILPYCRPYLLDATYPSLFESSHSCLLAIFDAKKAVCKDLMPFYLDALLDTFPQGHLSEQQLSHALCTILACTSDVDDAASYFVIERLEEAIKNPQRRVTYGSTGTTTTASAASASPPAPPLTDEAKLSLQLTCIDLLPYVNLVLLRSLLSTIESWIMASRKEDTSRHEELCKRTFKALEGMDDTARQEGVRWWLDKREAFGV